MRVLLVILGLVVIGASLFADYKWRRWMEARRRAHQDSDEFRR